MTNKEKDASGSHNRPCHYCFIYEGLFWMVPISSQVKKYQDIYDRKIKKRGFCDTIRFGYVNGKKSAFLLQNAFPVTQEYIDCEYAVNHGTVPVVVNKKLSKELNALLRKIIRLYESGTNLTFVDLDTILKHLH